MLAQIMKTSLYIRVGNDDIKVGRHPTHMVMLIDKHYILKTLHKTPTPSSRIRKGVLSRGARGVAERSRSRSREATVSMTELVSCWIDEPQKY